MSEVKRGPGRPAGSRNKSIAIRTEALRSCVSPEKVAEMGQELVAMALDVEAPYSDRIKAMTLAFKYLALSADVELLADAEKAAPSPEAMLAALKMIDAMKTPN